MPRITVGIRIRPFLSIPSQAHQEADSLITVSDTNTLEVSVSATKHTFSFDSIFPESVQQKELFDSSHISRLVDSVLEGYNGTIFAYGQTGAGKTHTMSGRLDGSESQYGVCVRAGMAMFAAAKKSNDNFSFRLSVMEIYNECIYDLLEDQSKLLNHPINPAKQAKLNVLETESGVIVPTLRIMPIDSADDAISLFIDAQANRAVAEHQLNQRSSRSHVIYTYYITRTAASHTIHDGSEADPVVHQSKLHLVDLAGSERVNKTGSTGTVQKEANYINRSLSYLEQVVIALGQSGRDHIPYRQSRLTYLLKDSLGGNCNTFLIACVWPLSDYSWETLSTLRFAARMKAIETNPTRNRLVARDGTTGRVAQQQIDQLRRELALRDFIHFGHDQSWLPALTKPQRLTTLQQCASYVLGKDEDLNESEQESLSKIEIHSLSQANLLFSIFKEALWHACAGDGAEERLEASLQHAFIHKSGLDEDRVKKLFSKHIDSDDHEAAASGNQGEISDSIPVVMPIPTDDNHSHLPLILNSPRSRDELLKEFTSGPEGKHLNEAYEQAVETLKVNKARQKDIVEFLNAQKASIDDFSSRVATAGDSDNIEDLQARLDGAKHSYRAAHQELQICKEQITVTQSLKKRAMATLLGAFNEYLQAQS